MDTPDTTRSRLLDKEGLREALALPSIRTVEQLVKRRKIPYIRLGYRTLRFDIIEVRAAIARLTVKEVGR